MLLNPSPPFYSLTTVRVHHANQCHMCTKLFDDIDLRRSNIIPTSSPLNIDFGGRVIV